MTHVVAVDTLNVPTIPVRDDAMRTGTGFERTMDMTEHAIDPGDLPTGGYVHDAPYLEMRLRMILTGTASMPTNSDWADALKRLLAHLAEHPMPAMPPARRPAAPGVVESALAAAAELDLGDWSQLVMASEHPVAALFGGRTIKGVSSGAHGYVRLANDWEDIERIALDVDLGLDEGSVRLTLLGTHSDRRHHWDRADLTMVDADLRRGVMDAVRIRVAALDAAEVRTMMDAGQVEMLMRSRPSGLGGDTSTLHLELHEGDVAITGSADVAECIVGVEIVEPGRTRFPAALTLRIEECATPHPTVTPITLSSH